MWSRLLLEFVMHTRHPSGSLAQPDIANLALPDQLLQLLPRPDRVLRELFVHCVRALTHCDGPVDEVQIEVGRLQPGERLVERGLDALVVRAPQLARDLPPQSVHDDQQRGEGHEGRTKTSERGTPDARTPSPTSLSLP